jgi:hypothetical protein
MNFALFCDTCWAGGSAIGMAGSIIVKLCTGATAYGLTVDKKLAKNSPLTKPDGA